MRVLLEEGGLVGKGFQMMRLGMLARLAIPLLLAVASATAFFRMLIVLVLALIFVRFLFMLARITGKTTGKVRQKAEEGNKFVESEYRIIDDSQEYPK